MSWLTRRLDHLGSAAAGGIGGITLSQAPAFTHAYLQRLGGHIDEARRTIDRLAAGDVLPWLEGDARAQAVAELTQRLTELEQLRQAVLETPAMLRPIMLLRQAEWSIARAAAGDFVPAIPIDPASIVWTLAGVVIAALAWDAARIPFWAARRARARRTATTPDTATTAKQGASAQSSRKRKPF